MYNVVNDPDLMVVLNKNTGEYDTIHVPTGEVISGSELSAQSKKFVFNADIARVYVCQLLREGRTMLDISKMSDMPSASLISSWRQRHPMFKEALELARKERAEVYHDKVVEQADELVSDSPTKEEIAGKKVAIDAYKWAASKGDPSRYGPKQEVTTKEEKATTIVLNTGIVRRSDQEVEDVECKQIEEHSDE